MDSDERVSALKRAYADTILNTAKEAAERVIVSERKAQSFQHQLKLAKQEGLTMLLRIKQMLDTKVSEAELTALSRKKKIDELEAQLYEAEDIVRDLREELREVQSELERAKSDKAQCLGSSGDIPTHRQVGINRLYDSRVAEFRPQKSYSGSFFSRTMGSAFSNQSNESHNCYEKSFYSGYSNREKPDLPSIISRRKGSSFYRNGCTQRILACEKDQLDREFSLSACISKTKDEISIKEIEGAKVRSNQQRQEDEDKKSSTKNIIQGNANPDCYLINRRKKEFDHLKTDSYLSINISEESTRTDRALSCFKPNSACDARINYDCSETSPRVLSEKGELIMHSEHEGNPESGGKLVNCPTDQRKKNGLAKLTREVEQRNMECGESSDIIDPAKGSPSSIELEYNEYETGNHLHKKTINDMHFKYTFQRKRKRDSLANEHDSIENNLEEKYVPLENNNIFDENCDLENITSLENGTPKESTSDTNADPENNTLPRDVAEEHSSISICQNVCSVVE